MAIKGRYDQYVQKMLDDIKAASKSIEGPSKPRISKASEDSIRNFSAWADPWNPLFNDREYGKKTRYGDAIATPIYQDCISSFIYFPEIDPRGGYTGFHFHHFVGEDWENLKPIRMDETFTVFHRPLEVVDITVDGDHTVHDFAFVFNHADILNQAGEVVSSVRSIMDISVQPEPPKPPGSTESFKDHVYAKEELAFIDDLIKSEKIRGATPLYWEDVQPGEVLPPATIGPSTRWDMVAFAAARQEVPFFPTRKYRQMLPCIVDPKTNVSHFPMEWHVSNEFAQLIGEPRSFHFGGSGRSQMGRIVTNWMGDDAELRTMSWRNYAKTFTGDTAVVRARVVGKRIEGGEYLVDVDVWMDNLCRGNVTDSALVTIALPARNPHSNALAKQVFSTQSETKLKYGDKVRFKVRSDGFPTGYPLDDAEGEVSELFPWQRHYSTNGPYVSVKVTKSPRPLNLGDMASGPANTLFFREDTLEKL